MLEKLTIEKFSVIKKVQIDIKKINLLIGSQASGKSVIAKSCYFFRNISKFLIDGIRNGESKRNLDKKILQDFESRFPRYIWDGTSFFMEYKIDKVKIRITGELKNKKKTTLVISYCAEILDFYNYNKRLYRKKLKEAFEDENIPSNLRVDSRIFYNYIVEPIRDSEFSAFFQSALFIPASRSFFANLQKNIFTFMASNLDIDPFLKEFGSAYETAKTFYSNHIFNSSGKDNNRKTRDIIEKSMTKVIDGEYEYNDDQDWILKNNKKINLANSSSGQQESVPMLLALSVWPFLFSSKQSLVFIEEPEAHLFPTAQSNIVAILSYLVRDMDTSFFLTTHSPYIVSALNNHIFAGGIEKKGKLSKDEFTNINGLGVPLNFSDVSAYSILKGVAKPILDKEYELVGTEVLDSVSEHFQGVMNKLLDRDVS